MHKLANRLLLVVQKSLAETDGYVYLMVIDPDLGECQPFCHAEASVEEVIGRLQFSAYARGFDFKLDDLSKTQYLKKLFYQNDNIPRGMR